MLEHYRQQTGPVECLSKTSTGTFVYGPRREKTCLWGLANIKGADQPAHVRSLISPFVSHLLESIISRLATSKISLF